MYTLVKFILAFVLLSVQSVFAQNESIATGTILEIVKPEGPFRHLNVPPKNFIIKRGGIANFNSLSRNLVVVTAVEEKDGATQIEFRRKNGRKFFRNYPTLTANWPDALQAGELRRVE